MRWQLQEAKNKLSQLIQEACKSGPQVITVRGRETVVVLSAADYRELTAQPGSLVDFLQSSPWADIEVDIERSKDVGRPVEL